MTVGAVVDTTSTALGRVVIAFLLATMMTARARAFTISKKSMAIRSTITSFAVRSSLTNHRASLAAGATRMGEDIVVKMQEEAEEETKKLIEYYGKSRNGNNGLENAPMIFTTSEEASSYVDNNVDTILFDCDGVLYRAPDAAPGATKCIESLLSKGKQVFFVTNNAGSNRRQLREKLTSILQVNGLTEDMMISSSYSCAEYLKSNILDKKIDDDSGTRRLYVIGSDGLCEELRQTGFEVFGGFGTDKPSMSRDELANYEFPEHPVDAVVVGHDIDLNFRKLCIANVLLQRNPDALLVATNRDSFDLVGADARHIVGNGCIVQALEYASKRTAVNVGKPSQNLADLIATKCDLVPSRSMIVGDRLDTDIQFGANTGMLSALVMTGVTTAKQLIELEGGTAEEPLPSIVVPFVGLLA